MQHQIPTYVDSCTRSFITKKVHADFQQHKRMYIFRTLQACLSYCQYMIKSQTNLLIRCLPCRHHNQDRFHQLHLRTCKLVTLQADPAISRRNVRCATNARENAAISVIRHRRHLPRTIVQKALCCSAKNALCSHLRCTALRFLQ